MHKDERNIENRRTTKTFHQQTPLIKEKPESYHKPQLLTAQ
jgi:hypothetical protein